MRIEGTTWTGSADSRVPSQGSPLAGMLIPAGRGGDAPPLPHAPADEFLLVHDPKRGAVVIDLYHAATRYDDSPSYRLTEEGNVEVGKKPRKGGIIDLLA
ncbi:MAG: hypothetical protein ACM337_08785 [Syntrophaceae bacterium]